MCVRVVLVHTETFSKFTRGRFGRTHGTTHHTHNTRHNTPQHHTETETERDIERQKEKDRERQRETERDREREEKTKEKKTRQEKRKYSFSVVVHGRSWLMECFFLENPFAPDSSACLTVSSTIHL